MKEKDYTHTPLVTQGENILLFTARSESTTLSPIGLHGVIWQAIRCCAVIMLITLFLIGWWWVPTDYLPKKWVPEQKSLGTSTWSETY